ncbi:HNH endonuclease [Candidatus Woesearchaeota archaeon]|nr:HNH endonuclease [Candidatus Woesearchaeota archaeon]
MPPINEARLKKYGDKLYRGELTLYKKKLAKKPDFDFGVYYESIKKPERVGKSTSQAKSVKSRDRICKVCSDKHCVVEDNYNIHHVNGDRSKTTTDNMILVCLRCHKRLHTYANAKLKNYKVKTKSKSSSKKNSPLLGDIGNFGLGNNSKKRKKKDPFNFY